MKEVVSKVIRKDIIILIIAILVLFYVLVQASVVPFWNKELETVHIDVVYSDMTSLKSDLTDVAQHGIPRSSMIHLGVLYPNRFLFFNPGPGAAGNLTVENVGITGSYAASGASTHQISYDSSRIIYVLDGIIPGPKLVYEHGIIIWDWGDNRTVTANNQSLINDDTGTIFIPVVNANPCVTSGVETEIFEIYPYSNTSDRTGVESVTITLDTDYPELWQELLKAHIKAGLVSVSNQTKKIRIRSSTLPYISLPDQPAPGVVSSGIITFSKEQPAVLTIPAAIMQNATVEKKVTSTPKVTPTPTPTARARVSGGGGGGGGGGIADEPPIVTTENATNVFTTSATLNMGFEFHDYRHVRVQFRYKAEGASAWNETGWVSQNGSGAHTYAEPITNLSANTTYNFTALLSYDRAELNGTWFNFTTSREPIPQTIWTGNATNVSTTSATLNMGFEFHDYRHVRVQFRYKAEGASVWNETGWVSQNGSGSHTYAEPLANLSANTTYYFTALLSYNGTELNGTALLFTTGREPIPPTVWTGNATNVSVATTTLNMGYELSAKNTYYSMAKTEKATCVPAANVTLDMGFEFHDYSSVLVQFRYKAEGATGWTDTGWVQQNGSGTHTYAKQITNLSPNTTYYYMALLLYEGMAVNGSVRSFTTCREPKLPAVTTENATNVSTTSATLNMGFEFNDYSPVQVQFRYKAEGASAWNETGWVSQNDSGAHRYAKPIVNLSANTTYYFIALLLYDGTELNGTELLFTTSREPIPPTVWTGNATESSPNSATRDKGYELSAKTTYYSMAMPEKATCVSAATATLDMGFEFHDYSSVQVQFRYKAEGATGWTDTGWVQQNGSGTHTYAKQITNLSANTTYYFIALLLYDGMEVNGSVRSFTTCQEPKLPAVVTEKATNVSTTFATLNMGFEFNDYRHVRVQFRYKAEGASTWNETGWVSQNGSGAHRYAKPIVNLSANTTYYFIALLLYDGTELNGTTLSLTKNRELIAPTVATENATSVSEATATLNMGFEFNDYTPVQVQFRYKAEGASVWNETCWVSRNGSGTHTHAEPIANLSYVTTYYFKAQLRYDGTVIEGVENSFTTLEPPTIRTGNAANITDVSATLNMTCDLNDYDSVQVQFKYKAEGANVWAATGWVSQNESQTYSESIANLSAITTYYFKAQLLYDSTEIEGVEKSFMTSEPPAVHTKTATNITDATATLNMAFGFNEYNSVHVQFRYKANDTSEWNDSGWIAQNGSGYHWYREPIAGLSSSTVYQFKALLRYDGTVIEGPKRSFITMEKATVSTKNAIVQKLPRGWAATLKMDYDFKDYDHGYVRFAYKKVGAADWDHTDWTGASHSGTYDELIRGLDDHTTYYTYAQLKYGDENNIQGDTLTFKTLVPR